MSPPPGSSLIPPQAEQITFSSGTKAWLLALHTAGLTCRRGHTHAISCVGTPRRCQQTLFPCVSSQGLTLGLAQSRLPLRVC